MLFINKQNHFRHYRLFHFPGWRSPIEWNCCFRFIDSRVGNQCYQTIILIISNTKSSQHNGTKAETEDKSTSRDTTGLIDAPIESLQTLHEHCSLSAAGWTGEYTSAYVCDSSRNECMVSGVVFSSSGCNLWPVVSVIHCKSVERSKVADLYIASYMQVLFDRRQFAMVALGERQPRALTSATTHITPDGPSNKGVCVYRAAPQRHERPFDPQPKTSPIYRSPGEG